MNTRKPEDWMDTAERLGNQIARGLEVVGDKVQQALESLDDVGRRPGGVTIEDERDLEGTVAVESLIRGDVFEHRDRLYMRLGPIPDARRAEEVDVVDLENGNVRMYERGTRVRLVDAKVVVKARPQRQM